LQVVEDDEAFDPTPVGFGGVTREVPRASGWPDEPLELIGHGFGERALPPVACRGADCGFAGARNRWSLVVVRWSFAGQLPLVAWEFAGGPVLCTIWPRVFAVTYRGACTTMLI
jgi:hypothetical protein